MIELIQSSPTSSSSSSLHNFESQSEEEQERSISRVLNQEDRKERDKNSRDQLSLLALLLTLFRNFFWVNCKNSDRAKLCSGMDIGWPLNLVLLMFLNITSCCLLGIRLGAKLMFDVVCTLTDMDYIVFHATVKTAEDQANMEFFIRHIDGTPISSDAEKQRVILCLRAAIERIEGVQLELWADDRPGLLADVMRTFRENGINVTRAEIATTFDTAQNVYYVTDAIGNPVDQKIIEAVRQKIGIDKLKVKELPSTYHEKEERDDEATTGVAGAVLVSLGRLLKRNLFKLGLIKSLT